MSFSAPQNSQRRLRVPGANDSFAPQLTHGNVLMKAGCSARVAIWKKPATAGFFLRLYWVLGFAI
jgi:hypothetical protein